MASKQPSYFLSYHENMQSKCDARGSVCVNFPCSYTVQVCCVVSQQLAVRCIVL